MRLMKLGLGANGQIVAPFEMGIALLAVHAGIALADAVLIELTGKRSTAVNHEQAGSTLKKACGRRAKNSDGVRHFEWLVNKKDYFAYGERRVRPEDVAAAQVQLERMVSWVNLTFPDLLETSYDTNATT